MADEYYEPLADLPLFGNREAQPQGRMLNVLIIFMTTLLVIVTSIIAFTRGPNSLDILFVVCIILVCISHLTLICWYKLGDLDPKFKYLIYFNALCIVLLCICGNMLFFK